MSPDPMVLDALSMRDILNGRGDKERRAQLHRAAVARRKKAKRGGKR